MITAGFITTAGFWLQLAGSVIVFFGLFTAWNRASGRADQWLRGFRRSWIQLSAQLSGSPASQEVYVQGIDTEEAVGTPRVIQASSITMPDERIQTIEKALAELDIRIDGRIEKAIGSALSDLNEQDRLIKVSDIYWALGGLALSTLGFVVEHLPTLCS